MGARVRRYWLALVLVVLVVAGVVVFLLRIPAPSVDPEEGTALLARGAVALRGPAHCVPGGVVDVEFWGPGAGESTTISLPPQEGATATGRHALNGRVDSTAERVQSVSTSGGRTTVVLASAGSGASTLTYVCSNEGGGVYAGRASSGARPDLPLVVGFSVTDGGRSVFHVRVAQDLAGATRGIPALFADAEGAASIDSSGRFSVHLDLRQLDADGGDTSIGSAVVTATIDRSGLATGDVGVSSDALHWHGDVSWSASTGSATEVRLPSVVPLAHAAARGGDLSADAVLQPYPGATSLDGGPLGAPVTEDEVPAVTYVLPRDDGSVDRGSVLNAPATASLSFATTNDPVTVLTAFERRLLALGWRSDDQSSLDAMNLRLEMVRGGNSIVRLTPGYLGELSGRLSGITTVHPIDLVLEHWGAPVVGVPAAVGVEPSPLPLCVEPGEGADVVATGPLMTAHLTTTCYARPDRVSREPSPTPAARCSPPAAVVFVWEETLVELAVYPPGDGGGAMTATVWERDAGSASHELGSGSGESVRATASGGRLELDVSINSSPGPERFVGSVPCGAVFTP